MSEVIKKIIYTSIGAASVTNEKFKELILNNEHQQLIDYAAKGKAFQLSVPTPEHYLPLLYTLALKDEQEKITLFNDKLTMGSISMLSLRIE